MFGPAQPIPQLEEAAASVVKADRARFRPFMERALAYAKKHDIAIGGAHALAHALGVPAPDTAPLMLLSDGGERAARDLANELHDMAPDGLGLYASARGMETNISVLVEDREVCVVRTVRGKVPRALYIPPLLLAIPALAALSDPINAAQWPIVLAEADYLLRRAGLRGKAGGRHKKSALRAPDAALAWLTERARRTRITASSTRLQYIVEDLGAEQARAAKALAGVQCRRRRLGVPTDERLEKLSIALDDKIIADVFNAAEYSVVALDAGGGAASSTQLRIMLADLYGTSLAAAADGESKYLRERQAKIADDVRSMALREPELRRELFAGTRVTEEAMRKAQAADGARQLLYFAATR